MNARAKPKPGKVDRVYCSALAAADRFLHDWQAQDAEDGLTMLTDGAKRHWSEDRLQEFFSPGEDAAYQIGGGRRLSTGRYAFSVTLLDETGGDKVRKRSSEIIVMRSGTREWTVDRLP
jgi:hypothetical protein